MYVVCTFDSDTRKRQFFTGEFAGNMRDGFNPGLTADLRNAFIFDDAFDAAEMAQAFYMLTHATPCGAKWVWMAAPLSRIDQVRS